MGHRSILLWSLCCATCWIALADCGREQTIGLGPDAPLDLAADAPLDDTDAALPDARPSDAGDLSSDGVTADTPTDGPVPDDVPDDRAATDDATDSPNDAIDEGVGDVAADVGADIGTTDLTDAADASLPPEPIYPTSCRPRTTGTPPSTTLDLVHVLGGDELLEQPVQFLTAPDGTTRVFVVNQPGFVVVAPDATVGAETSLWLDLSAQVLDGGEQGFLSIAFHPDFAVNGEVYVNYTRNPPGPVTRETVVSRFIVAEPASGTPDPSSEEEILTITQPYSNHNGGQLAFGPDGMLYVGMGDGGGTGDPDDRAQDLGDLLGKMLRIDVDSTDEGLAYAVPPDNPFVDTPGARAEIWASGLRNPWRFSFDPLDGTLWVGDVGQFEREEVDIISKGANYGWNIMEGFDCYEPSVGCDMTGLEQPVTDYGHGLGNAVTGGTVYRGTAFATHAGTYLFGDYGSGRIWGVTPDGEGGWTVESLLDTTYNISAFGVDAGGEVYAVDWSGDAIYRIDWVDDPGSPPAWVPDLSLTGCFEDLATRTFVEGVLSYSVNAPLWSDGAAKERGIALPDGSHIGFSELGAWDLPAGAVLIKSFVLDGTPVETRFLVQESEGMWVGATYRWNSEGTDAVALDDALDETIGGQLWSYPGPAQCVSCHTAAAGRVLGIRTPQMNRPHDVFRLGLDVNQIEGLSAVGYFTEPAPGPETLARFPSPTDDSADVGLRSRAYLDANCAHCHQPGGGTPVSMDLRHTLALDALNACDVEPELGDLGLVDARLIAPEAPDSSVLLARVASLDEQERMPPLASNAVDDEGVALLTEWIAGLTGCGGE